MLDLLITSQTNGIHFTALDRQHLKRARHHGNEQSIPEERQPHRLTITGNRIYSSTETRPDCAAVLVIDRCVSLRVVRLRDACG